MKQHPPLTEEQLKAVKDYATEHGRTWKESLRGDWINARTSGHLQTLRNSHGPSWLTAFRLPK